MVLDQSLRIVLLFAGVALEGKQGQMLPIEILAQW